MTNLVFRLSNSTFLEVIGNKSDEELDARIVYLDNTILYLKFPTRYLQDWQNSLNFWNKNA